MALLLALISVGLGADSQAAPGDMVFERQEEAGGSDAFPPAVFPHWVHRVRYRCYVCHDDLFVMERGANNVTMESINGGNHCGACHDGRRAFSVQFQDCTRCHQVPGE